MVGDKIKIYFLFILVLFFITSSCNNSKRSLIKVVSISTNGSGKGNSKAFAVEFNESLKVNYYGGELTKRPGFYEGELTKSQWSEIVVKSNNYIVSMTDTVLTKQSIEDDYFDLRLQEEEKNIYIVGYNSYAPKKVQIMTKFLLSLIDKVKLRKVEKTHIFKVKAFLLKREIDSKIKFVTPTVD